MKLISSLVLAIIAVVSHCAVVEIDRRAAVDDCLSNAQVPVFASTSSDRTQAIKPFNLRVPFTPAAYAVPQTVKHVQDAVACGVKSNAKVTAKSGGHSYGSHGLGGENGHLIIDLRRFNNITADAKAHTAVVGAGGRLGNIALALYSQGKQAMSHGTCPGVGVGGLTLHGGYGLISRQKGLTLDNLISAQVVLANSTAVTASATENTDLFWSLRGAGAAFGIVTSFTFKTFDAPEDNLVYSYTMQSANASDMANQLAILQNFTLYDQPPELNMRLFLNSGQLTGVYYGSKSAYNTTMLPLLSRLRITARDSAVSTKSWTDTLLAFSNGPLKQPEPYDYHETQYAKSLMPDRLSTAALIALSNYFFNTARSIGRPYYLLIDMHGGNSSAISQIGADATSYVHRNAVFKMQFYDIAFGSYNSNWYSFLTNWVRAITDASPGEKFGMYINYADTQLNSTDAHTRYWGSHYEKLAGIKAKYDPGKIFYGPQLVGS
ncbi:hypothetical protein B5807_03450 [Epicoccum nigrum]|uniref:FAD-binding PCMH-type domain-containing protein n=1 Tax=Epicoccum nigrum TaxID=105696 RepID=A0A1Y2M7H4_EPING|nr:hypothetical protein B5807_03450 [Epicoccum nigrum]